MTIQLGVPGNAGGTSGGGGYDGGPVSTQIVAPGITLGDSVDLYSVASPRANGGGQFPVVQNVGTDQDGCILSLMGFAADNQDSPALILTKSGAVAPGDNALLEDAEAIGYIIFAADDGADYRTVPARIRARVDDSTPGVSSIGGELLFDVALGVGLNDITNTLRLAADLSANFAGAIAGAAEFGMGGQTPQAAAASGGALSAYVTGAFGLDSDGNMQALYDLVVAIRAALVANGIMS